MECFKKKLVREFQERKKTLTTQIVRKSLLKKIREALSNVPIIIIVRGAGKNIRGIRRYNHGYKIKLLIKRKKSPSSPFFFIYSSTPLLIILCLNLRVGHKAKLLTILLIFF